MHILVVDDDEDSREVLRLILEAEGHRVSSAADGVQAYARMTAGDLPSLILLDLMMPQMDGPTLVSELKQAPPLADIPFIVISGDQAASERAVLLGAAAYLVKPVELEELIAVVKAVAERPAGVTSTPPRPTNP
jgi:CheY-like chemotaxis protein